MVGGQRPPRPQGQALGRGPLGKPAASPPAGRSSVCLSLTQTLSHIQKGGETETGAHTAKPTTRSAVERRASLHSLATLPSTKYSNCNSSIHNNCVPVQFTCETFI